MQLEQFNIHLTDIESVMHCGRAMSIHVDNEKINAFIIESQEHDIKNALGDNLYIDLLRYVNKGWLKTESEWYEMLLNGCVYSVGDDDFVFKGLKQALNYFVYARLVKHGDGNLTQFGWLQKDSEHSSRPDIKHKQEEYKDAFCVAESLMNDVIRFLKHNSGNFPKWKKQNIEPRRGIVITKIGD